ncbi:MAG: Uma2 family endonuclease [Methylococcaceae bacterium]|nr:Uma2 family endonuclease [Methylococcaceae bacterium]
MKLASQSRQHFTYADYRQWPEEERWEIIDGEAYAMSPAPNRIHQTVAGEIFRQIANFLEGKPCQVYIAPFDLRLPEKDEADDETQTVVQPDIMVVCDDAKLDDRGCRSAPDWIIEVLSPSTASRDHVQKKALYERHGVRAYWLVHPADRVLTRYRLENGVFTPALIEETQGATAVEVLPGLEIQWSFMAG